MSNAKTFSDPKWTPNGAKLGPKSNENLIKKLYRNQHRFFKVLGLNFGDFGCQNISFFGHEQKGK